MKPNKGCRRKQRREGQGAAVLRVEGDRGTHGATAVSMWTRSRSSRRGSREPPGTQWPSASSQVYFSQPDALTLESSLSPWQDHVFVISRPVLVRSAAVTKTSRSRELRNHRNSPLTVLEAASPRCGQIPSLVRVPSWFLVHRQMARQMVFPLCPQWPKGRELSGASSVSTVTPPTGNPPS